MSPPHHQLQPQIFIHAHHQRLEGRRIDQQHNHQRRTVPETNDEDSATFAALLEHRIQEACGPEERLRQRLSEPAGREHGF